MEKPKLKPVSYVLVYQRNLEGRNYPFRALVLKTKYQRMFLRWELRGGGFTEQWVNRGCCSAMIAKSQVQT